jgi:lysophospholipase L1-like esterase
MHCPTPMRTALSLLGLAAVAGAPYAEGVGYHKPVVDPDSLRILAVGDSTTWGTNCNGDGGIYEKHLVRSLGKQGVQAKYYRAAVFGMNLWWILTNESWVSESNFKSCEIGFGQCGPNGDMQFKEMVGYMARESKPHIVLVMLGINDMIYMTADVDELYQRYEKFIHILRSSTQNSTVVLMTPMQSWWAPIVGKAYVDHARRFTRALHSFAAQEGLEYIDLDGGKVDKVFSCDGTHQLSAGNNVLASLIAPEVTRIAQREGYLVHRRHL